MLSTGELGQPRGVFLLRGHSFRVSETRAAKARGVLKVHGKRVRSFIQMRNVRRNQERRKNINKFGSKVRVKNDTIGVANFCKFCLWEHEIFFWCMT